MLEVRHGAGVELAPHSHVHTSLCCVLDGGFDEWMEGVRFRAGPDCLLVEPAGLSHRSVFGGRPTQSLIIEVEDEDLGARLLEAGTPLREPGLWRGPEVATTGRRLVHELRCDDRASPLAVEGIALELLASALRLDERVRGGSPPPWLEAVATRLRESPLEAHDHAELAHAAGVHPAHLARTFRRYYGESLGEHLRRLRLAWCADRLLRSDVSVATLAVRAGFCDQSHLARHFRRAFGCAPGAWRRRHRKAR